MTDPKDTGLPEDAGNGMSSRAGYYDESESGRTETPAGQPMQDAVAPDAVPTDGSSLIDGENQRSEY